MALAAGKHVMLEKPPGASVAKSMPCSRLRRGPRSARCSPPGTRASRRPSSRRGNGSPAVQLTSVRSPGRRMFASGIPDRPGFWSPAGSAFRSRHQRAFDPHAYFAAAVVRDGRRASLPGQSRRADRRGASRSAMPKAKITAEFDFRQTGPQSWDIVSTPTAARHAFMGGARSRAGEAAGRCRGRRICRALSPLRELAATGETDVDLAPLQLVADAFLLGRAAPSSRSRTRHDMPSVPRVARSRFGVLPDGRDVERIVLHAADGLEAAHHHLWRIAAGIAGAGCRRTPRRHRARS